MKNKIVHISIKVFLINKGQKKIIIKIKRETGNINKIKQNKNSIYL